MDSKNAEQMEQVIARAKMLFKDDLITGRIENFDGDTKFDDLPEYWKANYIELALAEMEEKEAQTNGVSGLSVEVDKPMLIIGLLYPDGRIAPILKIASSAGELLIGN